jgi:hypothetical protein
MTENFYLFECKGNGFSIERRIYTKEDLNEFIKLIEIWCKF